MYTDEFIKNKIKKLYEADSEICLSAILPRFPLKLNNVSARIEGVFAHIFAVEVVQDGFPKRYFFQYGEVITKNIIIKELDLL